MKIILTEEQYKSLINENLFKDTLKDLKINTGILFTFGTGMAAFLGPVERLLTGSGFSFNETEISLLIITAIAHLINDKNKELLFDRLKEMNLTKAFDGVKNLIKNSTNIIREVVKGVLGVSYSLSEILGFAFLLNPVMKIIGSIINDRNITTDNLQVLVSGVVLGGIVFFIKNLLKKSKDKLDENYVRLTEDNTDNLLGYLYEMGFDNDDAMYELNNITDYYDNLPETLTLYRIVFADTEEEVDTQYPGPHYVINYKNLLDSHYGSLRDSSYGSEPFVIKVKVQKQLIDFYESIKNNILYPNEEEITLKNKGFGADIIEIMPVKF
jgi:hypothetical protein